MKVLEQKVEMTYRPAQSHLELMDVDTLEVTHVRAYDYLIEAPNWLPGDRLLYNSGGRIWFNSVRDGNMQVYRMNADGTEQTRMTRDARNDWFPHVSPDGKRVVYISYDGGVKPGDHPANKNVELTIMDADGRNGRLLQKLFGGQGTINVNSWAPDSKRIAYVRYGEVD